MPKALVKKEDNLPVNVDEHKDLLEQSRGEMAATADFRPPMITIAPAGANVFMKNEKAIGDKVTGIILGQTRANAFWVPDPSKDSVGSDRFFELFGGDDIAKTEPDDFPLCTSNDGINGSHEIIDSAEGPCFGSCSKCFLNCFGSDLRGGKGKACKNAKRLLMLLPRSGIPNVLTLPPTSIRAFDDYATALYEWKLTPLFVHTTIGLKIKEASGGIKYSIAVFETGDEPDRISETEIAEVQALRETFLKAVKVDMKLDEVEPSGKGGEGDDPDLPF